jgi:peptidyl-prolyl cis-trans isomerase A (cyclophilin A)
MHDQVIGRPSRRRVVTVGSKASVECQRSKEKGERRPRSAARWRVRLSGPPNLCISSLLSVSLLSISAGRAGRSPLLSSPPRIAGRTAQAAPVQVVFETSQGKITVAVDTARAPITSRNFLRYVDGHFYDGGRFFRTVRADNQATDPVHIAVVQAAADPARTHDQYPPIPLERTTTTGLRHTNGTVSMARNVPNSATSSFFICIGDQPALDFRGARNPDGQGFAAFGTVVAGMDVVRAIWQAHANGQALAPPIVIVRAYRVSHA